MGKPRGRGERERTRQGGSTLNLHVLSATQRTGTPLGRLVRAGLANDRMVMRPRDRGDHESLRNPHSHNPQFFPFFRQLRQSDRSVSMFTKGGREDTEFGEGSDTAQGITPTHHQFAVADL